MNIRPNVATTHTYLNNLSSKELKTAKEKAAALAAQRDVAEELKTRAHIAAQTLKRGGFIA